MNLKARLHRLESCAPPPQRPTFGDEYLVRLMAKVDEVLAEKPPHDPAGRVRFYRRKVAEQTTKLEGEDKFYAAFAKAVLPEERWHLRSAELAVLEADGFDLDRLATWRAEHNRWDGLPWQWRGGDLPADVLAVIETVLAQAGGQT